MNVQDLMTRNPVTCSTDAVLPEVARLMVEHDCGEIPLYERGDGKRVVGVITDRDIACRAVASGGSIGSLSARRFMTAPAITVQPEDSVEKAVELMARNRVRRLPVVNADGVCVGILSERDIAQRFSSSVAAEVEYAVTRSPQLIATAH